MKFTELGLVPDRSSFIQNRLETLDANARVDSIHFTATDIVHIPFSEIILDEKKTVSGVMLSDRLTTVLRISGILDLFIAKNTICNV